MTAILRLLRIETRRSLGLWLFLPMVGLAWYVAWVRTTGGIPADLLFWPEVSSGIRNSIFFLGPLAGALAAFMAGRNHRRGIQELLDTTPRSPATRDLSLFSGTTLWPCAAYILTALAVGLIIFQRGTWGVPDIFAILVGLFGVAAAGALGYAAGSFIRSRFAPPLVAVAVLVAQQLPEIGGAVRYLSPGVFGFSDVFYRVRPELSLLQSLWFAGLTAVALAAVALKGQRTALTRGALIAAMTVSTVAAVPLLRTNAEAVRAGGSAVPYKPVCDERGVLPVCVHPAYRPLLPESALLIGRLTEPLVDIPGGPVRAEQRSMLDQGLSPDGTLTFSLYHARRLGLGEDFAYDVVESLAVDEATMTTRLGEQWTYTDVQRVLIGWLMLQAEFTDAPERGGPDVEAAVKRFDSLDPHVRRAWLEENYAGLRAGELTLEDLP